MQQSIRIVLVNVFIGFKVCWVQRFKCLQRSGVTLFNDFRFEEFKRFEEFRIQMPSAFRGIKCTKFAGFSNFDL
jgi:hypothetical protein